jgi:NAD(P)-dependent dehydrogenase (short-subunit alcohol dehydrogenase family)
MNIVVTGASAGLGKALCTSFRRRGHTVIGTSHDGVQVSKDPELVFYEAGQNASPIQTCVSEIMCMFDTVDVLVNNAGTNAICPFEELTPGFVQHIMDVNFMTAVFMTQCFLEHFNRPAVVVNIISDAAWRPMRHSLAYNCSKAALDMATKQMARELTKPRQLSIIGVRPGKMAHTAMSTYINQRVQEIRGWTAEEAMNYFRSCSVTGMELEPPAVAEFIASLATSEMAMNMSGACLDLVG